MNIIRIQFTRQQMDKIAPIVDDMPEGGALLAQAWQDGIIVRTITKDQVKKIAEITGSTGGNYGSSFDKMKQITGDSE